MADFNDPRYLHDWRMAYLSLREQAIQLASAAEDVDNNIMNNNLAFKRERMRWFIDRTRMIIEKFDEQPEERSGLGKD